MFYLPPPFFTCICTHTYPPIRYVPTDPLIGQNGGPLWDGGSLIINQLYTPYTPLKINIEPESDGLEDDFPFQTGDFQVPC